jgi:hypothetical protein
MIRSEVLHALQAYTALPSPVQGILEKKGQEFDFGAGLTRDKGFDRALKNLDVDVFCVKRLRILRSLTEPAAIAEGAFILRGKAVALQTSILAVASIIAGQLPEALKNASNSYLLELQEADVVTCTSPQQLPFGINVSTASLAPRWNYVSSVFSRKIDRALVACANGLFTIQASPGNASKLPPEAAEALLENLVELDLVAEAPTARPKVIYRVARNCIFVGDEASRPQVLELQRHLQLPTSSDKGKTLPTAISGFSLDEGIVSVQGPSIELQPLKDACPQGVLASRQSLSDWWHAPNSLTFKIKLLGPDQDADPKVFFQTKLQPTERRDWEILAETQAPAVRDLRPGETKFSLEDQLKSIMLNSFSSATKVIDVANVTQAKLDQATKDLGKAAEKSVRESHLFSQDITVQVRASLRSVTDGIPISLPTGDLVSIPPYSYETSSPRLNAYLGIFSTIGLQGSFRNWDHAFKNKILSL